jgi:hypothetical protein
VRVNSRKTPDTALYSIYVSSTLWFIVMAGIIDSRSHEGGGFLHGENKPVLILYYLLAKHKEMSLGNQTQLYEYVQYTNYHRLVCIF